MSITVRRANLQLPTDISALVQLRLAWHREDHGPAAEDMTQFAARFAGWLSSGDRAFWLAQSDDEVIGMVNLVTFTRMPQPDAPSGIWGYLSNAYVRKDFRDRGVGALLVSELLAAARERGMKRVVLHPSERSVPFYRRLGFTAAESLLLQEIPG